MLDDLESAITGAAVRALRRKAQAQRIRAADGSVIIGEAHNRATLLSPEARVALGLAANFDEIAGMLEMERPR
jgi:hypothetical protein